MIEINKIRVRVAALLAIIFISSLLVSPIHVFLLDHDSLHSVEANSSPLNNSNASHKDCSICHFSFSLYTPLKSADFDILSISFFIQIFNKYSFFDTNKLVTYTQLRAPPINEYFLFI